MTTKEFELHWQYCGNLRPHNISPGRWKGMIMWLFTRMKETKSYV